MSKRYNILASQYGERKKPKLDVTVSDHNFPLSQNCLNQDNKDTWGDDNDDEILLLASQACEQAFTSNDIESLPDYNLMKPPATSTQYFPEPQPSTSKTNFEFKIPTNNYNALSTYDLKSKCNRISSPLHGISSKVNPNAMKVDFIDDDYIAKDKIYKEQDSENIYKQLLQLQEENSKLKSENGKLLEKCVTKEGEVSILRTQLKTCQVAVDNVRLEKVRAQEKVQMEYTEKLASAKSELHNLRTQLDFKNLAIISVKERCKMLESSKVKLTQVCVANNDINTSQRLNNSMHQVYSKNKMAAASVQTEDKNTFINLHKRNYLDETKLLNILPVLLQETFQENPILDYNEKLQKAHDFTQIKCRIFSTFHRIPSSPVTYTASRKDKLCLGNIYEDLSHIASSKRYHERLHIRYINVFAHVKKTVFDVMEQLENVSQRVTVAFQREMDDRYMDGTAEFVNIDSDMLLQGRPIFKDEQAILARRSIATLYYVVDNAVVVELWCKWEQAHQSPDTSTIDMLAVICKLLDSIEAVKCNKRLIEECSLLYNDILLQCWNKEPYKDMFLESCALLYSGFLMSVVLFLENLLICTNKNIMREKIMDILKYIITSRAMPAVLCKLLDLLRILTVERSMLTKLCLNAHSGNLKVDYDQGVMLYKKDSCLLQILLKQTEAAFKAMEKQISIRQIVNTTRKLLGLYCNINSRNPNWVQDNQTIRCKCAQITMQIVIYALYICATNLRKLPKYDDNRNHLQAVCRCGMSILYQLALRDVEFITQLGFNEGHYHIFVESCDQMKKDLILDDMQDNMLMELLATLQTSYEDVNQVPASSGQVWMDSFYRFNISD